MLKKIIGLAVLLSLVINGMGQYRRERTPSVNTYSDEDEFGQGFKKEHLFIGGNLGLGLGSYSFNAGISPELGYSFTQWLDAGVLLNLNYTSVRADPYYNGNIRQRSFNYGAGAFARFYPLSFLFLQVGPEYNWIHYNFKNLNDGSSISATTKAMSFLAGIGYGQRIVGRSSFRVALMIDLLNNPQSPYRDNNGVVLPVLKTGFDIYLGPKKK